MSTPVETDPRAVDTVRGPSPERLKTLRANVVRRRWLMAGFTGPALLVYALFVFVPVGLAFGFSLFAGTRTQPTNEFVGFANFIEIFTAGRSFGQPFFWDAVRNNFGLAIASLVAQGPIAIGVALLLNRKMRFRNVIRLLIFVPYVISEVITGVIFSFVLAGNGVLDIWLERIFGWENPPLWLGDSTTAFWSVFLVITWKYVGFAIILFLAGLSGVPDEVLEAAQLDGANWWQIQRRITIPLLGPTIRIWAFLSIIGSFQLFDMVWILSRGNPTPIGIHTMASYMVQMGMNANRVGYGSAVAVVLFVITLTIALTYQKFILSRDIGGRNT